MLYEVPELYDALFAPEPFLAHYSALAERHGGPILELACGTGQLTVPLARPDRRAVGIDCALPMLEHARRRAERKGANVEFEAADMRSFERRERFPLIFVARNSLLHLHTREDLGACLTVVRRHLAPEGIFAFDIFNPDVKLLASDRRGRAPILKAVTETWGELIAEATGDYDAAAQVNRSTWYISAPNRPDAWVVNLDLRCIFPQELPLLLEAYGLRLLSRNGDFDGSPFTSASPRQICLCKPQ
ncbi:MAG: class I SAM-dependent methyltransferase [Planctomycetes bacterium]|nr:class I SAM-dependent methyltransferase [Planctomycetota bacterium]